MSWIGRRLTPLAVLAGTVFWAACGDIQESPVTTPDAELDAPPVAMTEHQPAPGGGSGAIFTTDPLGDIVNENVHYESKSQVYLDGGPPPNAPAHAAGLDEGYHVFQVTDPPGHKLLSRDPARCRIVYVSADGVITRRVPANDPAVVAYTGADADTWVNAGVHGQDAAFIGEPCAVPDDDATPEGDNVSTPDIDGLGRHDTNVDVDHGFDFGAITVQLMPYGTTPNPGGVYKAWMTPLEAYVNVKGANLNAVPKQMTGRIRPHPCYDFCADPDPGFVPSNRYTKTDNFKVTEQFTGEIKVRKFHDLDGDGYWDEGEPEIGVDEYVQLDGTLVATMPPGGGWPFEWTEPGFAAQTEYTPFMDVIEVAGTYTAEEHYLDGWKQSASWLDGVYDNPFSKSVSVDVVASGETHEIWFGNYQPGRITGTKVIDYDGDGVIDEGDVCSAADAVNHDGCAGVKVTLTGTDGMGNAVGPLTTTTDANGDFAFEDVDPGTYTVEIKAADEPVGFNCSYPSGCKYTGIVVTSGDHIDLNGELAGDAAFADWQPGSKSGIKYEDRDFSGHYNPEAFDAALEGWGIAIFGPGGYTATTTTAENGTYQFTGLTPGTYTVCEFFSEAQIAAGWFQTGPDGTETLPAGESVVDCPPAGTDDGRTYGEKGYQFTVTSGSVHLDNDFGNALPFAFKVCKYKDDDGSLLTDNDQYPRAGWLIRVKLVTPGGETLVEEKYTQEPDGCVTFEGLRPPVEGYYLVQEETRDGWVNLGAYVFNPGADEPIVVPAPEVPFDGIVVVPQYASGDEFRIEFYNSALHGCTPGFWGGGQDNDPDGAGGQWLWDDWNDLDWNDSGGQGTNPYIHTTLFNDFFTPVATLDGLTMHELVNSGGGEMDERKAARSLTAAYLNASWGMAYAYTTGELVNMWNAAVASGDFLELHMMLDKANNAIEGCPISASW